MIVPLAARLRNQSRLANRNLVRKRFTHIVNGQRRNGCAGERLHLNAGSMMHLAVTINDGALFLVHLNRNLAIIQAQRVTERNQFVRALRCHAPRNNRR